MLVIQILIDQEDDALTDVFHNLDFRRTLLNDHRIRITHEAGDVRLTGWKTFRPELLDQGPLILHDCSDFAAISPNVRRYVPDSRVLRVLKGSVYRDLTIYNSPYVSDTYHGYLLAGSPAQAVPHWPPLDDIALSKLRLFHGFARAPHQAAYWKSECRLNRPFDLHFAVNLLYPGAPVLTQHRELALKAVCEYAAGDRHPTLIGCSIGGVRAFTAHDYRNYMLDSRMVLSPWGWGEYCHRDFEAMFCQCILIKPDTGFAETWPRLQAGEQYLRLRLDYSDLTDIVTTAKDDWYRGCWQDRLAENLKLVAQAWNPDILAARFAECLKGI